MHHTWNIVYVELAAYLCGCEQTYLYIMLRSVYVYGYICEHISFTPCWNQQKYHQYYLLSERKFLVLVAEKEMSKSESVREICENSNLEGESELS